MGRQLFRAGSSIGANLAEGYGRYSQGAYRNHLSIARGSAFEAEGWLDLLMQSGYTRREVGERLIEQCSELQKLLSYRMKALDQRNPRRVKDEKPTHDAD
jgi:four helix bundle protein